MSQTTPPTPLPVNLGQSNFARRAWWRGFNLTPGVTVRTTARLRPALAELADHPRELLLSLAAAASAALCLHPRLNFYTFWGRLVWAGEPVRVGLVLERPDQGCVVPAVADAHLRPRAEVWAEARAALAQPAPAGAYARLRERWPLACYAAERASGAFQRRYVRENAPLFISMLALKGIEDATFAPAHSMALFPGWPEDGRLPLTLCYNHQLANARPVARLLLTIRDLLE